MHSFDAAEMTRLRAARRNAFAIYLIALVAGALLTVPLCLGVMSVLDWARIMPPPPMSNSLCVDEKLTFMRGHRPTGADLLVVGSSSAMRHFNSPEAIRDDPGLRPYNAGFCGVSLAQSEGFAERLSARLPRIRQVLLFVSPLDVGNCGGGAGPSLNMRDASDYVFGNRPRLYYYIKYFDPAALLFNSIGLRGLRTDNSKFDSLAIDAFGDAPVQPPRERREWYLKANLDDRCFASLRETSRELGRRGVQLAVVESPMNPKWRQEFDPAGAVAPLMRSKIAAALSGTGAVLIPSRINFSAADFYDAVHLRAPSTAAFTRGVMSQLKEDDARHSR